jgi:membrane protease YdiL (CAAX protease family)
MGYRVLISNILIVLGFMLMANSVGSVLIQAGLGGQAIDFDVQGEQKDLLRRVFIFGQVGGTFTGLVLLPVLYLRFLKKDLMQDLLSVSWVNFGKFSFFGTLLMVSLLPLIGFLINWNKNMHLPEAWQALESSMKLLEEKAAQMTKLFVYYETTGEMLLVLFVVALLPAVAEELVFRGILQKDLLRSTANLHLSVWVSAAVFSFVHFQFFGFFPRMFLGLILGYLYVGSGNLLVPIILHFVNNAIVVIALNSYAKGSLTVDPEAANALSVESICVSAVISSVLLYICWKLYKQRTEVENR